MRRLAAGAMAVFVAATVSLFAGSAPVSAEPAPPSAGVTERPVRAPDLCSTEEWRTPARWDECVNRLPEVAESRAKCLAAPTPNAPDSGMAGWFATAPSPELRASGRPDLYTKYGYAGYDYTTYDIGCVPTVMHPDYKFENTVASGELALATGVLGAANAAREKAWEPSTMWGWADPLVETATRAVYEKVFTVFGTITLAIVGLYLLWRSRQSDMSAAMTTAGWALLVMVAVTAIASWPTASAHLADRTLTSSLAVVHEAVGPPEETIPSDQCRNVDAAACADLRSPALRASDTVTEGLLYRNWLRGLLGSADSATARKYGPVLHDAKALSWDETLTARGDPALRKEIIDRKQQRWMRVAEQIKTEDPEAYEYLQGTRGMDRIGAGFIAVLSTLFFALFDLTASLLVLLGFLLFRWAVIAAPLLGTVGLLRPASSGVRRLANAVVAAIFNIVIFGTGAAVYLFAVTLIIKTPALPGWLQVVLILLMGVVGWLILRPYRRITQLGGKDATRTLVVVGGWPRRGGSGRGGHSDSHRARREEVVPIDGRARPEVRGDGLIPATADAGPEPAAAREPATGREPAVREPATSGGAPEPARAPARTVPREPEWVEPDPDEGPPQYAIYRPTPRSTPVRDGATVTRRPESEPVQR